MKFQRKMKDSGGSWGWRMTGSAAELVVARWTLHNGFYYSRGGGPGGERDARLRSRGGLADFFWRVFSSQDAPKTLPRRIQGGPRRALDFDTIFKRFQVDFGAVFGGKIRSKIDTKLNKIVEKRRSLPHLDLTLNFHRFSIDFCIKN